MNSKKSITTQTIDEALSINDIDKDTRALLSCSKKDKALVNGINIDRYDIHKCSELKEIVNYRMERLQLEKRPLVGAQTCIEKLKKLPKDMPTSWASVHIDKEVLIFIINRVNNSIIHAMSFISKNKIKQPDK
ncbi:MULTISPECIES: hypothetical protein [Pseudomonas]|uniref:hypothetical protein n=1 Tax=Pseudomonas TaxID=286 RepID=UPI000624CF21|nr:MULTISPECIES: hypothetical protein [Pseudomonas]AKF53626.1 hypothetical protein PsyrH_24620 [Pseudomonas syringae pv. syringae HS191]ALE00597.1 hypothetical protein PSYRMG_14845 [Pseudomonas syringae UMAF0158]KTC02583.1 hypothetical protein AO388_02630 [Pseudomonas sp. ICMP 10191]MBI6711550.1 hypothetical protein [Pseudomonas syringae]MCK9694675.1 hypothetical protein [Pseudomonas syringae pv. syringae]